MDRLPEELYKTILEFLKASDVARWGCTCRAFAPTSNVITKKATYEAIHDGLGRVEGFLSQMVAKTLAAGKYHRLLQRTQSLQGTGHGMELGVLGEAWTGLLTDLWGPYLWDWLTCLHDEPWISHLTRLVTALRGTRHLPQRLVADLVMYTSAPFWHMLLLREPALYVSDEERFLLETWTYGPLYAPWDNVDLWSSIRRLVQRFVLLWGPRDRRRARAGVPTPRCHFLYPCDLQCAETASPGRWACRRHRLRLHLSLDRPRTIPL